MKPLVLFFIFSLIYLPAIAQQITFSTPERKDVRSIRDFRVIGKLNNNFLVYKIIDNKPFIDIYDNGMNLKNREHLNFLDNKIMSIDFIAYHDFTYIIYQFQKKDIVYCMAAALDDKGEIIKNPFELDKTQISFLADIKIYNLTYSEDKSKIMIYKIHRGNENFNFTTILFNDSLKLIHKSIIKTPFKTEDNIFSDFFVDNSGNFIFTKGDHFAMTDYFYHLSLVIKSLEDDSLTINEVNLFGVLLDEINLKIDNVKKQYLINSLLYTKIHGNVEGLYTALWNQNFNTFILQYATLFSDSLGDESRAKDSSKILLTNFGIREVILKKNDGFILTVEDFASGHGYNDTWLRGYTNYNYTSFPYLFSSRNNYRGFESAAFNDIVILNFNDTLGMRWIRVIHKLQFNTWHDRRYLSYFVMNNGATIHFLFDEEERHRQATFEQTIGQDGKISTKFLLRGLKLNYQLMPSFATQVSSYETIIPCTFRSHICFAKITY